MSAVSGPFLDDWLVWTDGACFRGITLLVVDPLGDRANPSHRPASVLAGPAASEGTSMDIQGIAAVVTGGASGLGEATARELARRGAKVAVFDRDADKGEKIAAEIGGRLSVPGSDRPQRHHASRGDPDRPHDPRSVCE